MMLNFYYNYSLLFVFFFTSFTLSFLLISLTEGFSKKIKEYKKLVAYEFGFQAFASARIIFDVHFFIVALLFLVFDIELMFLYPWSISLFYLSDNGVFGVYCFILFLIVGYIYDWRRGALNWTWKS